MAKQPKKSTKKVAKKPATDWAAVLRNGTDGVKKWNKLTAKEREAVKFASVDLSGVELNGANLSQVNAKHTNLNGSKLANARLSWSDFEKGSFVAADLSEATLDGVNAHSADFSNAKLIRASAKGAELIGASFAGADLTGANLTESFLGAADFTSATLTDVIWMGAKFDDKTKWPTGFAIPGELKWTSRGTDPRLSGKGKKAAATDINGLMARLHANIDEKRMQRTLDMLKKERNQIFSVVEPTLVRGIVKSQRDIDTIYSCVLCEDGTYSCGTPDMSPCMGLSNEPCKHLLVLIIGLARAGELDPATVDKWVVAAKTKNPRWNKTTKNHIADSFLRYKGAQAGEIDWRPTETIPEDFYAM